jgi:hypothetical protein
MLRNTIVAQKLRHAPLKKLGLHGGTSLAHEFIHEYILAVVLAYYLAAQCSVLSIKILRVHIRNSIPYYSEITDDIKRLLSHALMCMHVMDSNSKEASGVVELDDEQFSERNEAARKTRSDQNILVSCTPHSYWFTIVRV